MKNINYLSDDSLKEIVGGFASYGSGGSDKIGVVIERGAAGGGAAVGGLGSPGGISGNGNNGTTVGGGGLGTQPVIIGRIFVSANVARILINIINPILARHGSSIFFAGASTATL